MHMCSSDNDIIFILKQIQLGSEGDGHMLMNFKTEEGTLKIISVCPGLFCLCILS